MHQEVTNGNGRRALAPALTSSDSMEWYTPKKILDPVIELLGSIDLDPCSNSKSAPNVPAARHYTADDMGQMLPWSGRIYMNPPYGDEIEPWIPKLIVEYESGNVTEAVALVPARTDTDWFEPLFHYPLCFVHGRLKFSGHKHSAPFPSVVAYFGPNGVDFVRIFSRLGSVVPPAVEVLA
jgi:DNA N-6-adenine-methyltransferase (Dam)